MSTAGVQTALTPMVKLKAVLKQLTFNSKEIINDITRRAATLKGAETQVTSVIANHMLSTEPRYMLSCLYVIDSILKNVGGLYIPLFAEEMPDIYRHSYPRVIPIEKEKFKKVLRIWRENPLPPHIKADPSYKIKPTSIFPEEVLQELEAIVTAVDNKKPIPPPESFAFRSNSDYTTDVSNQEPVKKKQHVDPSSNPITSNSTYTPTNTNNTPINDINNDKKVVVDALLLELNKCIAQTKTFILLYPQPNISNGFNAQIQTLESIFNVLKTTPFTELTPEILEMLTTKVSQFVQNNNIFQQQNPLTNNNITLAPSATTTPVSVSVPVTNSTFSMDTLSDPTTKSNKVSSKNTTTEPKTVTDLGIVDFSQASLCKNIPGSVWLLYGALDIKCKQCGMRYKRDSLGAKKMTVHLDWHFRQNRRAKSRTTGGMSMGIIREWFLNEEDWVHEVDESALLANGDDTGKPEKQNSLFFEENQSTINQTSSKNLLLDLDEREKLKKQINSRSKMGIYKTNDAYKSNNDNNNNVNIKFTSLENDVDNDLKGISPEKVKKIIDIGDIVIDSTINTNKCSICMESFTKVYNEDKEAWVLKGVVRTKDGIFHKSCFIDS